MNKQVNAGWFPRQNLLALLAWLGITFIAAALGALGSAQARTFYEQLSQPTWAPPGSVFGPVWTILYLLMGIAAFLVWRERHGQPAVNRALGLYLAQLVLNALWSWLFFAWQQGAWAFVDIMALWVILLVTIVAFWRIHSLAGILLLPYLAWVTFAAVLNYTVWQMNSQLLGS